jgi:hypothetical protein
MGRPIKEKYFGNTNSPYSNQAQGGATGVGGEGVATTIVVTNTGTGYSQGSVAVFSTPQIPGGTLATGTLTIGTPTTQGRITAATLVSAGSGYTSTATVSITTASSVSKTGSGTGTEAVIFLNNTTGIYVGMGVTGTGVGSAAKVSAIGSGNVSVSVANASTVTGSVVFADYGTGFTAVTALTSTKQNAINGNAYITGGSAKAFDIKKQEASKRYLVQTADGQGQCKLVTTATLAAGEMNIVATDWNGSTYWVRKLTARRAVLVQSTASTAFLIADGASTGWTLGSSTGTIVTIGNN